MVLAESTMEEKSLSDLTGGWVGVTICTDGVLQVGHVGALVVGALVAIGFVVGRFVGALVVGRFVGAGVGRLVGNAVVGALVDGAKVVGADVVGANVVGGNVVGAGVGMKTLEKPLSYMRT